MSWFSRLFLISLMMFAANCGDSAEEKDQAAVQRQQKQYRKSQPLPAFDFSLERDAATKLYKARNERVSTWTVWRSAMGTVEGDCPSIGYPIPYDTSLTNPVQRAYYGSVVEQAEPNGLFSSKNSIATWIRCVITANGKVVEAPFYVESQVTAYPYPVDVNYDTNRVRRVAGKRPSVVISETKVKKPPQKAAPAKVKPAAEKKGK